MDLSDMLNIITTDKEITVMVKTGEDYHVILSGFKEDITDTSVFDDVELNEVSEIIDDNQFYSGLCLILDIEEETFTIQDDDKSGHIDFYEIANNVADPEMQEVYDELGFYML